MWPQINLNLFKRNMDLHHLPLLYPVQCWYALLPPMLNVTSSGIAPVVSALAPRPHGLGIEPGQGQTSKWVQGTNVPTYVCTRSRLACLVYKIHPHAFSGFPVFQTHSLHSLHRLIMSSNFLCTKNLTSVCIFYHSAPFFSIPHTKMLYNACPLHSISSNSLLIFYFIPNSPVVILPYTSTSLISPFTAPFQHNKCCCKNDQNSSHHILSFQASTLISFSQTTCSTYFYSLQLLSIICNQYCIINIKAWYYSPCSLIHLKLSTPPM